MSVKIASVLPDKRFITLDVIRGFALFGILLINVSFAGNIRVLDADAIHFRESNLHNFYAWYFMQIFAEGKMRCLFSMLFGAGIILFTSKTKETLNTGDAYFRRMMWLLAFGLADSILLLWMGDILYQYALCGMLIFVFRNSPPKKLVLFALIGLAFLSWKMNATFASDKKLHEKYQSALTLAFENKTLNDEQKGDIIRWGERQKIFFPFDKGVKQRYSRVIEQNINNKQAGYIDMFKQQRQEVVYIHSVLFYQTFWEIISAMFIGMALYKCGFLTGRFTKGFYVRVMFLCLLIGLPLSYLIVSGPYSYAARYYTYYISHNYFDLVCLEQIPRFALAIAYASGLILICRWSWADRITNGLAAVGRMAFSNYILQSVLYMIIFYGCGMAMFGSFTRIQLYIICGFMCIFHILFSSVWLNYFHYGPLEWVWRSLTFRRLYPMLRIAPRKTKTSPV
jgi:uncharacterized protein